MHDLLKIFYNKFDPFQPADPTQFIDLTEVRGGNVFTAKICEALEREQGRMRALFTGHQGTGKSSELAHLAHELQTPNPKHQHKRYFPIVLNVQEYVDIFDASLTEILLAIVAETAAKLQEEGIELKDSALQKRFEWVRSVLRAKSEPTKVTIDLWRVKMETNLRLATHETRDKVRKALEPQTTTLIEEINSALAEARISLRGHPPKQGGDYYSDLVLVLDNMEKIIRVSGRRLEEDSRRALFVDSAELLRGPDVHTIYTVPLALVRAMGPKLSLAYGKEPFVLPNVKTEMRASHKRWEPGRAKLKEIIATRIHPYTMKQAFEPAALEFLLDYCGGHIRQLMMFVREASLNVQEPPITLKAAESAIRQAVPGFAEAIRPHQWALLAQLERSEDQQWDNNDGERRELLEQLTVLEYLNGETGGGVIEGAMRWYAAHPIVRELPPFKTALSAQSKVSKR